MRTRIVLTGVLMMAVAFSGWADEVDHDRSLEEVTADIRDRLGLSTEEPIDPETVPDDLLVTLGDVVMAQLHPNEREHAWMDQMMGGEGSASLDAAHRWMAYRYLTGGYAVADGYGYRGGMMGGGMMGYGMMGPGMMSGSWGLMGDPDRSYGTIPYGSPEEILRRRLGAGEITRREYRRMLRALDD